MILNKLKRFEKFFRLLGSNHDGEALAALNLVKRTLEAEKISWNEFVNGLVKVNFGLKGIQQEQPKQSATAQGFEDAFSQAFQANKGKSWQQWAKEGEQRRKEEEQRKKNEEQLHQWEEARKQAAEEFAENQRKQRTFWDPYEKEIKDGPSPEELEKLRQQAYDRAQSGRRHSEQQRKYWKGFGK